MARDSVFKRLLNRGRKWLASKIAPKQDQEDLPSQPPLEQLPMPPLPDSGVTDEQPEILNPPTPANTVRVQPIPVPPKPVAPPIAPDMFNVGPEKSRREERREELRERQDARIEIHQAQASGNSQRSEQLAESESSRRIESFQFRDEHKPLQPAPVSGAAVDRRIGQLDSDAPISNVVRIPPEMQGQEMGPPPGGFRLADQDRQEPFIPPAAKENDNQEKLMTERQGQEMVQVLREISARLSELNSSQKETVMAIQNLSNVLPSLGGGVA